MFTLYTLNIVFSLVIGYLGRRRKLGFWGLFFGSLFLTPIIGLVVLLSSEDVKQSPQPPG